MEYKYLKTIIQFRLPIKEGGMLGNPEVTRKFTTEDYAPFKKKPSKKKSKVKIETTKSSGEVYL